MNSIRNVFKRKNMKNNEKQEYSETKPADAAATEDKAEDKQDEETAAILKNRPKLKK